MTTISKGSTGTKVDAEVFFVVSDVLSVIDTLPLNFAELETIMTALSIQVNSS